MVLRDEFEKYLRNLYSVDLFEDYCVNGLVVEGKEKIEKIGFGVSFNSHFLDKAVSAGCDAVVVHHGIFKDGFFSLKGYLKERVKCLIDNDVSLFSIHLPMDAHPKIGHNALLFKMIGAKVKEPIKWGFYGSNRGLKNLNEIVDIFEKRLSPAEKKTNGFKVSSFGDSGNSDSMDEYKIRILKNGPEIPENIVIVSGSSTDLYERAISMGADTFICGDIREHIPAISFETKTNFLNLGHYFSEKPGIIMLKEKIHKEFNVNSIFIEIPNPV